MSRTGALRRNILISLRTAVESEYFYIFIFLFRFLRGADASVCRFPAHTGVSGVFHLAAAVVMRWLRNHRGGWEEKFLIGCAKVA